MTYIEVPKNVTNRDDTDILLLLIHHFVNSLENDIFFMTDKNVKEKKIWKIKDVKNQLPDKIVDCILPCRAVPCLLRMRHCI